MATTQLPIGAHALAHAEANAFARIALELGRRLDRPPAPNEVMVYLVNAGLAVELYFKAFMIRWRAGKVTRGHDLKMLLDEFPGKVKSDFNLAYAAHPTARTANIGVCALRLAINAPDAPSQSAFAERYRTFDEAIQSLSNVFTQARYFFENLATPQWAVFSYPIDAIEGVLQALENTHEGYMSGRLVIGDA